MEGSFDEIRVNATRLVWRAIHTKCVGELKTCYKSYQKPERDVKSAFDQAFRDVMLELIEGAPVAQIEQLVTLSIDASRNEFVFMSLPVALLADIFDLLTIPACSELFHFVEQHVHVWKEDVFFTSCKNTLLRMCNDLLRRISKTHATIFCGRILLFLARFFPFSERSGLNIVSEFNLENVTAYSVNAHERKIAKARAYAQQSNSSSIAAIDYGFYCKFWALQDFFRNPMQCYEKANWKMLCSHTSSILNAFAGLRIERPADTEIIDDQDTEMPKYFTKYLTNQKLLELQLFDVNFRRSILLQLLILFQYLNTIIRLKSPSELTATQKQFIQTSIEKVHALLRDTPPDGDEFDVAVTNILSREEFWSEWKRDGCPDFRKTQSSIADRADNRATGRQPLGELIRQAHGRNEFYMAKTELTHLWNLSPNNLEACKARKRDFLPSPEVYFAEETQSLSALRDAKFIWRALRLLSRRSQVFFVQETMSFAHMQEYLDFAIRRIQEEVKSDFDADDMANVSGARDDDDDEEELFRQVEDDDDGVAVDEPDEMDTTFGESEFQVQNILPFRVTVLTVTQFHKICASLQDDWMPLAKRLGYNASEINDIQGAKTGAFEQTTSLLNLWFEEDDDSTLENFQYILESLQLMDAAYEVKIAIDQNQNLKTDSSVNNE